MLQPRSSHPFRFASLALLGLTACGGGGGKGSPPLGPPSDLNYPFASTRLLVLVNAPPNVPTVTGSVTSWSVTPALPAGLALDSTDGTISGTPVATRAVLDYVVTAANSVGSTSFTLELGVTGPAQFVYVANQADDTITLYAADAHSGGLSNEGYVHAAMNEDGPASLSVRPDGRFLYAANAGDGLTPSTVSVYAISSADGQLTAQTPAVVGIEARDMAMSDSGSHLYVASFGSDAVYVLSVATSDGALSPAGSPALCGDGPAGLALDPAGRFLWVLNRLGGSISTFAIDETTGALTPSTAEKFIGGTPSSIVADDGERVLVTYENSDRLAVFDVDPSDGSLTKITQHQTGAQPARVVLHPAGRFAYVADEGSNSISTFAVDSSGGALTPGVTNDVGILPSAIVFDPSGWYAYVIDETANEVGVFAVDLSDGSLSFVNRIRTRAGPSALAILVGPAPLIQRGEFLYAVNNESADLTSYRIEADGSMVETGSPALVGNDARDIAVDPFGRYLVAVDSLSNAMSIYTLDPDTGEIGELWPIVTLKGKSRGVTVDPTGRWIYVVLRSADVVESFEVDVELRELTLLSSAATGAAPFSVAVDPTGRFLYTSNATSDNVTAFSIEEGMIQGPGLVVNAPGNPQEVRFSPGGDYAIIPLESADHIATFAIDPHTGDLVTVLPGRASRNSPQTFGVHRSGRFAYAAVHGGNLENGGITSYSFDASTARITDGEDHQESIQPRDLALDPTGSFLFSADEGTSTLSSFVIDPSTGRLVHAGSVATGLAPRAIALTKTYVQQIQP